MCNMRGPNRGGPIQSHHASLRIASGPKGPFSGPKSPVCGKSADTVWCSIGVQFKTFIFSSMWGSGKRGPKMRGQTPAWFAVSAPSIFQTFWVVRAGFS